MDIKFLDLAVQYQNIKQEINVAVTNVLESSQYILGPEVEAFEEEFANAHGCIYGVAVNSGTTALHLSLLAAGIGPGDEVITTAMTFTATAAAISYTGATPVFCDIDEQTRNIDPTDLIAKLSSKTKAVVPVHLHGLPAEMDKICDIASKNDVLIIEDCAQAHLASYQNKPVGGFGAMGCFSFYPGKNLGAYGEGGIIVTNSAEYAEHLKLLRDWGQKRKYHHEMLAYNARMDGLQGAILRVKLKHLPNWTDRRREIAETYREALRPTEWRCSEEVSGRKHVYHVFSVFHSERDRLKEHLEALSVPTSFHYPVPVHLQKAYAHLGYKRGDLPNAESVAIKQLSLPIYPEMPADHIRYISSAVNEFA